AQRLSFPHTVALVIFGIVLGSLDRGRAIEVSPQLVLSVFLPGLVFEAALRLEIGDLRRSIVGVSILAVPGVVLAAALVSVALSWAVGMPLGLGFVVGAMVSPTDPAAVIATFKRIRAPRGLSTFVEAESLFNDGTGIVLFTIAVAAIESPVHRLPAHRVLFPPRGPRHLDRSAVRPASARRRGRDRNHDRPSRGRLRPPRRSGPDRPGRPGYPPLSARLAAHHVLVRAARGRGD